MSDESQRVVATCQCGARFKVKSEAVGRKAKCRKCNEVFVIKAPVDIRRAEPRGHADAQESLFTDLAEAAKNVSAIQRPNVPASDMACERCGAAKPATAVLCVSCGFNNSTGRSAKAARSKPSVLSKVGNESKRLFIGSTLSFVAAMLGAGVWCLVVIITKYEIGWIAWGIGLLAGYGMVLGCGEPSMRAGFIASAMSVVGIVAAKATVFTFVIYAVVTGDTNDIDLQRGFVAGAITEEILDEQEIWDEGERDARWDAVYSQAESRVESMTDTQVQKRVQALRAEVARTDSIDSESGQNKMRLARHRAGRHMEEEGLHPAANEYQQLVSKEFDKLASTSEQEIAEAIRALEEWENGGRWQDEAFVKSRLTYRRTEEAVRKSREAEGKKLEQFEVPGSQEWQRLRKQVLKEIGAMSPVDRLSALRATQGTDDLERQRSRIAYHLGERRARQIGLRDFDDSREAIRSEEMKLVKALSDDEVTKQAKEIELWEDQGKWRDADFVRLELTYKIANEAVEKRCREGRTKSNDGCEPTADEWESFFLAATETVGGIPQAQHLSRIRSMESAREDRWAAEAEVDDRAESREVVGALASGFYEAMFGPMDILFFALAIGSAFRLATGASDD